MKILVVEDDPRLGEQIIETLEMRWIACRRCFLIDFGRFLLILVDLG